MTNSRMQASSLRVLKTAKSRRWVVLTRMLRKEHVVSKVDLNVDLALYDEYGLKKLQAPLILRKIKRMPFENRKSSTLES